MVLPLISVGPPSYSKGVMRLMIMRSVNLNLVLKKQKLLISVDKYQSVKLCLNVIEVHINPQT